METRLGKIGWSVEWTEFAAGPPILEAIGKGKIALGYAAIRLGPWKIVTKMLGGVHL
ncbi:hypothetical protein QUA00_27630 [Microcoleus sp. T2B6]|uniref:hypothetical protein n=1 Tax=Microcoleus sp. T2B6 TaxID=3055424 RepID=UPI002FD0C95B